MNKNEKNLSGYGFSFKDYIRILENPDKIGLNNGIWSAPILKGYDKNQRGYGIDINTNKKAKALTNNRPGRWLTEKEADTLMDDHINYITEAANKHIKGFSELPFRRKWALLGMLYRGDSVNKSGININEPDDLKFFKSISNYYRSKGLNARANSSDEFFNRPVSKLLSMFKLKNGGYIRKMQTAAGGPLKIKFDPERIARLEYLMAKIPGMNNSGGDRYRKEGILALQHLELEAKRKEEEIKSRMEMRPTLKRKATKIEKLQGKKDEYELVPLVVGMSGTDPIGEFVLTGIGLNGVGTLAKTGLWNVAKYAPATQLGNWGRGYFVGNTFKNSFNGTVPILTPLLTSKNLFRTKVYKGGEIEDPYSNFLTTDPKYAANYGKVSPYIFESKSIAKAKEPMMGSSDPVTMDMFIYNNTKGNPNATAIIGHDKVTGEFIPSKGIEIYSMSPANLFKINNPEKGKIFTGFKEKQGLLDMINNSHNAPHPPIYERVSYSKYSADAANPKERDLVIQHFKSRYPNSGLQITTPLKISGFTYDNLLKVGELPLSEEGKAIADVMARRMKNYKIREGLDPNIVHFGLNRFSMSGINGMMNQIKNDKTIAYMPLKNSDNYGGLYEGGEALLKLNPWREKPYIYSLIHEGVSHMTDDFVKDLRTPVSGKKLLSDLSRNFDGIKASDSMYGRISYPNDIYDEKLIEKILHKDSMKSIESRSTNWEMITDLYKILAKEKGISYKLATELPDSEFGAFVEKTLDSPEKLSKFMEKFDNLYLLDYSNLMKAGTKELANLFYKRIKGMLKYGPSLITGGYFLTNQKQGGKMNILEFLKNGSGIHIKEKNKGSFTRWCGGNVTEECIRRGKNSPDPKIRKKATFAANARKWKHKDGGKAFVNGVSILDSNPDAYKYVKRKMKKAAGGTKLNNETIQTLGKTALNGLLGFIQTSALNNNLLKLADALKAQNKVQPKDFLSMMDLEANLEILNEMEQAAAIKAMTGLTINVNPDMARNKVWKRVAENYSRLKKAIDDLNKAIDALVEAQKQSAWGNLAGGLILSGIGLLGNYLGNKTSTNSSNSGAGWTMNYNSLYGSKNNYNTFFLTGSLPKMSSVAAPNTSWLNNNPLLA